MASALAAPSAQAASATWSPDTLLASDLAFSEFAVRVNTAVNPGGRSVVAWDKPLPATGGIGFGGPLQVHVAVRSTTNGTWSPARALSPDGVSATNVGAAVDPASGRVTVAWASGGVPFVSSSNDSGATWVSEAIPAGAGFALLPFASLIDTDGKGNITIILVKQRPSSAIYDVQAIVKSSGGTWRAPVTLTGPAGASFLGTPRLNVLSDGRAFLNIGATTFRRSSSGTWAVPQIIDLAGYDVVDQASADVDANGRGYFLLRAIIGGVPGVYVSTSAQSGKWSAPRRVAAFDSLGMWLQVTGSSSGRALVSGYDAAGTVRVSATGDGGATWGPLFNFGPGNRPKAVGSENGLYAVGWSSLSSTGATFSVAAGSGQGASAWTQTSLGNLVVLDSPSLAIAGKSGSSSARSVAGWEFQGDSVTLNSAIGASTATVGR